MSRRLLDYDVAHAVALQDLNVRELVELLPVLGHNPLLLLSLTDQQADEADPSPRVLHEALDSTRKPGLHRPLRSEREDDRCAGPRGVGEYGHPHLLTQPDEWL